ncbi:MAG TPA: hypothetical protein PKC28_16275 [Bdellovibrionales bacterium]|nr:hypothetical protein [Bdellovibrionales bacterium]
MKQALAHIKMNRKAIWKKLNFMDELFDDFSFPAIIKIFPCRVDLAENSSKALDVHGLISLLIGLGLSKQFLVLTF